MEKSEFSRLRERAGLTLEETAAYLGVSERTVYRYENGQTKPRRLVIDALQLQCQTHKNPQDKNFTFIDLFAGIGGMRLAFESIGGSCNFTSEWDVNSRKTYAANFLVDHELGGDIREYSSNPARIPVHDVLLAGFPCQPFSIAGVSKKNALGRPHGFLCDTQGTLFFDLAQIISYHQPKAFLLENVKNLERHDGGRTFATIMNVLKNELGYNVYHRVVSSEPWVPQKRERVFIVGFKTRCGFDFDNLEVPSLPGPKLGSILENGVPEKYTLTAHLWNYLQNYKQKHASKGNGFGYSLFGPDDVSRTLSARYYKDGSEVLISQPGKRPRRLTPRECARLMGYEEAGREPFKIPVSDTQAYRQFGNGVVVPAVKAVARLMKPYILGMGDTESAASKPFRPVLTQQELRYG
jgi:DNA (cytosine-5)-methyltransferase 1